MLLCHEIGNRYATPVEREKNNEAVGGGAGVESLVWYGKKRSTIQDGAAPGFQPQSAAGNALTRRPYPREPLPLTENHETVAPMNYCFRIVCFIMNF